eukprot:NODE_6694_length_253_cov_117.563725_g6611_i0.p2 GENE.NODE_6694_length_253_cov_117.563725_g6611_i0~~NODE_6694_length_253_cov_117.563725_g6611_i0.p2  ORF type:complete len:51 (+),score=5.93 NODE_6694_length_253_cov_117.563725_g6611_i0:72-224(+)
MFTTTPVPSGLDVQAVFQAIGQTFVFIGLGWYAVHTFLYCVTKRAGLEMV